MKIFEDVHNWTLEMFLNAPFLLQLFTITPGLEYLQRSTNCKHCFCESFAFEFPYGLPQFLSHCCGNVCRCKWNAGKILKLQEITEKSSAGNSCLPQVLQGRFSLHLPQCHEKEPEPPKAVNASTEGSCPGLVLNRSSPPSYTHSHSYIMYSYTVIAV